MSASPGEEERAAAAAGCEAGAPRWPPSRSGISGCREEGDDGGLFPAAAAAEEGEGRG